MKKVSNEQVIAAYRATGSVWQAGKRLGIVGQSVWERLKALGYPMRATRWTAAEFAELRALAGHCTISEIAHRLGRPYSSVATKISQLGIGSRVGNRRRRKTPREPAFTGAEAVRHMAGLEAYDGSARAYCIANSLSLELLVKAIQRECPARWDEYARRRSSLAERACPECGRAFTPLTKKQACCSRECSKWLRVDRQYFGGRRKSAVGLREGVCQLCLSSEKTLSAHHVAGKENDPDNLELIALCSGCHQLVGILAGGAWIRDPERWEFAINLALVRQLSGDETPPAYVHTCVEIEMEAFDQAQCG